MTNPNMVEIVVWENKERTVQMVEFDLNEDVCGNMSKFIDAVNSYLIEHEFIEEKDSRSLTNLELSKVSAIDSSKDINCDHYRKDQNSGELVFHASRSKGFGVYNRS